MTIFIKKPLKCSFPYRICQNWTLTLNKEDELQYPEIEPAVNLRVGKIKDEFLNKRILYFNGWNEFLKAVNIEYEKKL